ncbi:hypothetical protein NEMIN01_0270 [Nematocida minor]|uniref:uncharacterized protein n=1 Tax=Nematocida minor TaxID=1912983 RepID=UPI00221F9323|nr:uncharacterized protein NEMIN01_0270 [Nematocida minor]KAI5189104.1 hypothetical protein NEMIN01_0270 [Nematocida minor]
MRIIQLAVVVCGCIGACFSRFAVGDKYTLSSSKLHYNLSKMNELHDKHRDDMLDNNVHGMLAEAKDEYENIMKLIEEHSICEDNEDLYDYKRGL